MSAGGSTDSDFPFFSRVYFYRDQSPFVSWGITTLLSLLEATVITSDFPVMILGRLTVYMELFSVEEYSRRSFSVSKRYLKITVIFDIINRLDMS